MRSTASSGSSACSAPSRSASLRSALPSGPRTRRTAASASALFDTPRGRAYREWVSRSPLLLAVVLAALVLTASGGATQRAVHPLLGIKGSSARFQGLTGQDSAVVHVIVGWDQGRTWGTRLPELLPRMGPIPLLALSTTAKWPSRAEAITPAQIAAGRGDAFLLALNSALAGFGGQLYLRPFGEMNGHWNGYSAFTATGHAKPGHSTATFRKAFARVYLVAHGGPLAAVNAALARLGMAPVQGAAND